MPKDGGTSTLLLLGRQSVHLNRAPQRGKAQPELIHTVYEPGSFTPLLQLRRPAAVEKAAPSLVETIMGHLPQPMVRDMLEPMLRDLAATAQQLAQSAERIGMAQDVREPMASQFALLQQDRAESQTLRAKQIEVRHYLCDHLGTPHPDLSQFCWVVT